MTDPKAPPPKPFVLSERTVRLIAKLSPDEREQAIRVASKLLANKAKKRREKT